MTAEAFTVQRITGEGVLMRQTLDNAHAALAPLRATLSALTNLGNSISDSFAAVTERIEAECKRATEVWRAAYNALPRSTRRAMAQRKTGRKSADYGSKAWPGTDAVTPDHPTRVIYKHLLSHADISAPVLDRALERCSDADERAHRHADAVTVEVQAVTVEVEPDATDTPERIEHRAGPPQLLLAVTSSRNAPADAHARTVNSDRHTARQAHS